VRDGFTATELAAAKKELLEAQQTGRGNDRSLVGTLATQAYHGWTMQHTADREAKLAALTLDQVNAAARKYLEPASFAIFKAGDFKKK
jgi:zinc protease